MNILENDYLDWPGWNLEQNQFGDEFDNDARLRMIAASRLLIPYILRYKLNLNSRVCEIGPFFNPLINHPEINIELSDSSHITFLENDPCAIKYLQDNIECNIIEVDLNLLDISNLESDFPDYAQEPNGVFDLTIISQVLNYIDFELLLQSVYKLTNTGGLVFINNSINHGLPELFSEKRPFSNEMVVEVATSLGFHILENDLIPKITEKETHDRLILVLTKVQ